MRVEVPWLGAETAPVSEVWESAIVVGLLGRRIYGKKDEERLRDRKAWTEVLNFDMNQLSTVRTPRDG
jgi:hypothetical protein